MTATQISVDEGGIRHEANGEKRYVPFASIADVELRTRLLRDPAIVVTLRGGNERESNDENDLALFVGGAALDIHRELVEHLEARRAHAAVTAPGGWRRGGRQLAAWLSAVDSTTEGSYRQGADVENATAFSIAEDAEADIEDRAAAVHLLVSSADAADLVRVAKLLRRRPMPPIVQIAARLAPGGSAFVADEIAAEAASFVSIADRAEVSAASAASAPADERCLAAAAQARRELDEEARRVASTPPPRAPRSTPSMSDRDTSRWIGRSWGL